MKKIYWFDFLFSAKSRDNQATTIEEIERFKKAEDQRASQETSIMSILGGEQERDLIDLHKQEAREQAYNNK